MNKRSVRYVWARDACMAWDMVQLSDSSDPETRKAFLGVYVWRTEGAARKSGPKDVCPGLYRVVRECRPAGRDTAAPVGSDYAFAWSSPEFAWFGAGPNAFTDEIFDDVFQFRTAAEAVERADMANQDPESREGVEYSAHLYTWEVKELAG